MLIYELSKSVGEDLRIGTASMTADTRECMIATLDRMYDKDAPLLSKKGEETCHIRAMALGGFDHEREKYRYIIVDFFSKAKNLHSLIKYIR